MSKSSVSSESSDSPNSSIAPVSVTKRSASSDEARRVNLEGIDIESLLPFTRLFSSFRMAMQPGKLLLAFVMIVLVYMGGRTLDWVFAGMGSVAYPGEISQYARLDAEAFDQWLEDRPTWTQDQLDRQMRWLPKEVSGDADAGADGADDDLMTLFDDAIERIDGHFVAEHADLKNNANPDLKPGVLDQRLASIRRDRAHKVATLLDMRPRGIFASALDYKMDCLDRLMRAVVSFDLGLGNSGAGVGGRAGETVGGKVGGVGGNMGGVVGALRDLMVTLPGWLMRAHPVYWMCYLLMAVIIYPIFCGALARMAAVNASLNQSIGAFTALKFSVSKYVSFVMTPMVPAVLAGLVLLVLWLGGLVFFNLMVLDVVGGLLFFGAIGLGLFATMTLILLVTGGGMMYPALAVEGTDAFDVVSRVYNYVLFRPWRWLFYTAVGLGYGVVVYLVLAGIVNVSLSITQGVVAAGVGDAAIGAVNRFDLIMPGDTAALLSEGVDETVWLSWTGSLASMAVRMWMYALVALLWAFAVSFYFCAHTWIYLLLRRVSDGTEFDDIAVTSGSAH